MIIHNVRAISAVRALSDSRWGLYHCFITSIHAHGQLHLHRLHGLPLLQRWAGRVTKRFQLKTSATYKELAPLFALGHINLQT